MKSGRGPFLVEVFLENAKIRRWRMLHQPEDKILEDQFVLETIPLGQLGEGQVHVKTLFISLDPYLARMMQKWQGERPGWSEGIVHGRIIAEVIESRSPLFSPGDHVWTVGRWQEQDIFEASELERTDTAPLPPQTALGVLGRSGITAWVGLHLAEPRPGETLLVSAATGPVGSVAGQLARIAGCHVVGTAGGPQKCRHAVERLGFAACIDRHSADFETELAAAVPNGIDILFENVGGPSLDPALKLMNLGGRIMLCGLAAHYNSEAPLVLTNFKELLYRKINLRGFVTADYPELFGQALQELRAGLSADTIRYDETIIDGIEQAPASYLAMLQGAGIGKRLVRVTPA